MDKSQWVGCDSKNDMNSRLSSIGRRVFEVLITDDANTWGYLILKEKNVCIPVGFSDVGLLPQITLYGAIVYVGVADTVAGYDLDSGEVLFKYKVPTVFHEFVELDATGIIIQDETGFVGLSASGVQLWIRMCDDIVDTYTIRDHTISGQTLDGNNFKFPLPC